MFLSFCRMASKGKQSLEGCPSTPCRWQESWCLEGLITLKLKGFV
jgi:hypothetical protein